MAIKNVLLEIGTEEIPSRFIPDALNNLKASAGEALNANRIEFKDINTYATPRRLVLMISDVSDAQSEVVELLKGPPLTAAYDSEGNPTRAALGFAKNRGVDVNDLIETEDAKGVKYIAAEIKQESKATLEVLPELLRGLIENLNFPKNMYWNTSKVRFARPIRWIVALADDKVIEFEYANVKSGRVTAGHRFMGRRAIEIDDAAKFMDLLYDNKVILDQEKRLQKLKSSILNLKKDFAGNFEVEMDPKILEENLYLVEFPVPFIGSFDERYLEIPEEVLTTSMKKNQKYLAVRNLDKGGKLANYFVGVSNNLVADMGVIREGNERVLRARLEDAAFFWDEDRKRPLASYTERLKSVTYQEKLGSVYDKVMKTQKLALWLCEKLGKSSDSALVERAAFLSKADLVTNMVFEFTDLQGVMGEQYALASGENPRVALAIREQYLPQTASDAAPTDDIGAILGMAERLYTITACHKVGLEPTGSQDPYGLRRAARCINEILWARNYDLDINEAIAQACVINEVDDKTREKIDAFISQRLLMQLKEKGYDHELASLAISVIGSVPRQTLKLIEALTKVKDESWFTELVSSAVRVRNILQKNANLIKAAQEPDEALMVKEPERYLFNEINRLAEPVKDALKSYDWHGLTQLLAELSPVVASFFEDVMVIDPDEKIRDNRIALLVKCNNLFKEVGDLGSLKLQK
ncbi:MAG: glycine--tRNA ligase subunit beta [Synergistaceae bacterium]|nr:glycine--tRNA ligase subunit beta [Synergistaceae bacterium]